MSICSMGLCDLCGRRGVTGTPCFCGGEHGFYDAPDLVANHKSLQSQLRTAHERITELEKVLQSAKCNLSIRKNDELVENVVANLEAAIHDSV